MLCSGESGIHILAMIDRARCSVGSSIMEGSGEAVGVLDIVSISLRGGLNYFRTWRCIYTLSLKMLPSDAQRSETVWPEVTRFSEDPSIMKGAHDTASNSDVFEID